MQYEITVERFAEASFTFAMTMVILAPYLYWMIRVKPREALSRRTWALVSINCLFLGAGLIFAAFFGSARNELLPSVLAYPFFTAWKGVTMLCVEVVEVLSPLILLNIDNKCPLFKACSSR